MAVPRCKKKSKKAKEELKRHLTVGEFNEIKRSVVEDCTMSGTQTVFALFIYAMLMQGKDPEEVRSIYEYCENTSDRLLNKDLTWDEVIDTLNENGFEM